MIENHLVINILNICVQSVEEKAETTVDALLCARSWFILAAVQVVSRRAVVSYLITCLQFIFTFFFFLLHPLKYDPCSQPKDQRTSGLFLLLFHIL